MSGMVGGGAYDVFEIVAAAHCHVGGGVGVPADGVEESRIVGVEDCVGATLIIDIEGPEGLGGANHCVSGISCMNVIYVVN